jgi:threonine synthase
LYPAGKISASQEQQIAGLGENITALAVESTFDKCQQLVKQAFTDNDLAVGTTLISANSINIARWLPQSVYYILAWHTMHRMQTQKNLVIPCGNYGNISSAMLLHAMGYRFDKIIAAHNSNDTIPRYLLSGQYAPQPTVSTFANAMDVSDPSNFGRMQYLLARESDPSLFFAASVSDDQILSAIRDAWDRYQYLLDPHTATAYHLISKLQLEGTIVATAHPFKFKEVIIKALGFYPETWRLDEGIADLHRQIIPADYSILKKLILLTG